MISAVAGQVSKPWESWKTSKYAGHSLVGHIWSAREGRFIQPEELVDSLAGFPFILLGEIHDNPDHHLLQTWLIGQIVKQGRKPAMVMEMLSADQADALSDYLTNPDAGAEGLGKAVKWNSRMGWKKWDLYKPIIEIALASGLQIDWAQPAKSLIRKTGKEGLFALGKKERTRLHLDKPLPEAMEADLRKEIVISHCNMMPAAATGPMVNVQRLRDAVFASKMLEAGDKGAMLIAGGGHVRNDRAVPWYLKASALRPGSVSLMLIEVNPENQQVDDYMPHYPDGAPAADFIWFTPRAERPDPCEGLKAHLKMKEKKKKE